MAGDTGPGGDSADPGEKVSTPEGDDFTLLDAGAMVVGGAVASVHMRERLAEVVGGSGGLLAFAAFLGIAVTASGPIAFVVRRFVRRLAGYPRAGDVLWTILGLPWLTTALFRSAGTSIGSRVGGTYEFLLTAGLGTATLACAAVVWARWISVSPETARAHFGPPWTNVLGLVLAVAWPLQCGFGLIVLAR